MMRTIMQRDSETYVTTSFFLLGRVLSRHWSCIASCIGMCSGDPTMQAKPVIERLPIGAATLSLKMHVSHKNMFLMRVTVVRVLYFTALVDRYSVFS